MKNVLLLLTFCLPFAFTACAQSETATEGYKVGDVVKDFPYAIKNANAAAGKVDKAFTLKDVDAKKGIVVIFSCNHCPFVVASEDRMIELHKTYAAKGYPVVAINANDVEAYPSDSYDEMKVRAKEKGFPFLYLFDEKQQIARNFGAKKTPHVYVLDKAKNNSYKVRYIGAIDDAPRDASAVEETFLADALDALIAGKTPAKTTTKAIGCSIKWKEGH